MVLIRVDFPRPVWPVHQFSIKHIWLDKRELTNTHNIELKATFQQLPFDLGSNAIETDMAPWEDRRRGGACSGHVGVRGIRRQSFSGRRGSQWKEFDRKNIEGTKGIGAARREKQVFEGDRSLTPRIESAWYQLRGREQS